MTEKNIVFNQATISYRVTGTGLPVVLLHGFAEDHRVWKNQLDRLGQQFRLILPDLPGSGHSDKLPEMSMDTLAALVHQIIDTELAGQAEPQVVLLGHSMGGYVAMAFADLFPGRIRALGLVHSTAFADTEEKKASRRKGIQFIERYGTAAFLEQSAPNLFTPENRNSRQDLVQELLATYRNMDPAVLVACYKAMMDRPDRSALLSNLPVPVLFLIGRHDTAVPFADSMRQCHLPRVAFIEILEKSAHMGMWEEAGKTNQALDNFLSFTANNIVQT